MPLPGDSKFRLFADGSRSAPAETVPSSAPARGHRLPEQVRLDLFGRILVARLEGEHWCLFWAGEGTLRPAELEVGPGLDREQLVAALEDLCHEWATPERPRIRVLS